MSDQMKPSESKFSLVLGEEYRPAVANPNPSPELKEGFVLGEHHEPSGTFQGLGSVNLAIFGPGRA